MNQQERATIEEKFKVDAQFLCDRCDLPILGAPYIDVNGGYIPKPVRELEWNSYAHPKKTYHKNCDLVRRGKMLPSESPIRYYSKPSLQAQQPIVNGTGVPKVPIKRLPF